MDRRSFFKDIAIIGVASLFLPKIEAVRWSRPKRRQIHVVRNPEWVSARYEIYIVDQPPLFDETILQEMTMSDGTIRSMMMLDRKRGGFPITLPRRDRLYPGCRYAYENGTWRQIHPFVEMKV